MSGIPPPYPDPRTALSLDSAAAFSSFVDSLAAPSHYALSHPSTKARLKLALYPYALDPDAPHHHLFLPPPSSSNPDAASVSDDWSLASAQAQTADAAAADDEYGPSRRGKPCAHVFRPGESVYRCRDCGVTPPASSARGASTRARTRETGTT